MMKQRSLYSILCFFILSFGVASVSAQTCTNDKGTFRPNSTYDENRRLILTFLPSNVTAQDGLYYNGSIGQEPNRVYAVGMCIPGSTSQDCSDCIKKASDEFIRNCPNQTEAYSWPGDPTLCYVRYSNTSFSGSADMNPRNLLYNTGDIDTIVFTKIREGLMISMIAAASLAKRTPSSSNNYYIAESTALTSIKKIYGLMQCTPDLSSGDCENCLRQSAIDYQSCCDQKRGGVVMRPSCFLRWDLYIYSNAFNDITVDDRPSVASPPPQPADDQANTTDNDKSIPGGTIAAIVAIIVVTIILIAVGLIIFKRRKQNQKIEFPPESVQFDWKTIEAATSNFSECNKLGEGGFGEVYKGMLMNDTEIAVKRLSKSSGQGEVEFENEVVVVAKLQHINLVRLLGFSLQKEEKLLVYEFVPNKGLDYFLFDHKMRSQLDWTVRRNIIDGITRGILYLHQDSRLKIIHRDLKASNILLDANMNPKIADFGMARIFGMDQTVANTARVVGTFGYMSPEYVIHGQFSTKSDVYSFGVLVLEIISGRKTSSFYQMDGLVNNLVTYVWNLWEKKSLPELIDPAIREDCKTNEVTRYIHIGLLCVQENPADRPTMSTIHQMLTNSSFTLPVPLQPGFFFKNGPGSNLLAQRLDPGQPSSKSFACSVDEATITDVNPR